MSVVQNSESAQKRFEMGGGSQSSFTHTIDKKHDERWYRKTLPAKCLLKLNLKHLEKGLKWAKAGNIPELTAHVAEIKCSFDDYTSQVCSNISDSSLRRDLIDELATKLEQCCSSHETVKQALLGKVGCDAGEDCQNSDHEISPEDSASQVMKLPSNLTTSRSKSFARRIETDCKRAELRATFDCNLVKLKAKAKAEVEVAEVKKRMLLEEAKLDAEERPCEKSRDSSSVTSFKFKTGSIVTKNEFSYKPRFSGKNSRNIADDVRPSGGDTYAGRVPIETEPKVLFPAVAQSEDPPMASTGASREAFGQSNLNHASVFEAYLERQGRNEYINLANQIAYDGPISHTYFMRTKFVN